MADTNERNRNGSKKPLIAAIEGPKAMAEKQASNWTGT